MSAKKSEHAQRIIERYKRELKKDPNTTRYSSFINAARQYDYEQCLRYYCFPMLYAALFYEPTPEQIHFISRQAADLLRWKTPFFPERLMQFSDAGSGNPEAVALWQEAIPGCKHFENIRPLLIFGASHPNGYLRERCLQYCTGYKMPDMISAALIRLNDWVPEVRRTALKTLTALIQQSRAGENLIDAMPVVEHIRRSERAHREPGFSMDDLDSILMHFFEKDYKHVIRSSGNVRKLCYRVFALHPDPKYRGLILHFFQCERHCELRCMLERIFLQMTDGPLPEKVLAIFADDPHDHVRQTAYEYCLRQKGIWQGFEKLLFSPSRRIRIFAKNQLRKAGFDILEYCRRHLPESLPALGDFGTKEDIPRIRPYLGSHPCEAMTALVRLRAEDSKALLLTGLQSTDAKLSKAAYHLARSRKCFDASDLVPLIRNSTDPRLQYRLSVLLTKDGIWPALPHLIRILRDHPKLRNDLEYLIWKETREKAYVSNELFREIGEALAYAREGNAISYQLNNRIILHGKNEMHRK